MVRKSHFRYFLHFFRSQLQLYPLQILSNSIRLTRSHNQNNILINLPLDQDRILTNAMLLRNILQWSIQRTTSSLLQRSQPTVARYLNTMLL
jgi:hypothetical protein